MQTLAHYSCGNKSDMWMIQHALRYHNYYDMGTASTLRLLIITLTTHQKGNTMVVAKKTFVLFLLDL